MGLDLGAPAGTPVFSPVAAKLWGVNFLEREGDYGGTIILECQPPDQLRCPTLYMLFGHLAKDSPSSHSDIRRNSVR
jgi:murein DD-endopeptidase MepM/ murein hydrolase activator NlpD